MLYNSSFYRFRDLLFFLGGFNLIPNSSAVTIAGVTKAKQLEVVSCSSGKHREKICPSQTTCFSKVTRHQKFQWCVPQKHFFSNVALKKDTILTPTKTPLKKDRFIHSSIALCDDSQGCSKQKRDSRNLIYRQHTGGCNLIQCFAKLRSGS